MLLKREPTENPLSTFAALLGYQLFEMGLKPFCLHWKQNTIFLFSFLTICFNWVQLKVVTRGNRMIQLCLPVQPEGDQGAEFSVCPFEKSSTQDRACGTLRISCRQYIYVNFLNMYLSSPLSGGFIKVPIPTRVDMTGFTLGTTGTEATLTCLIFIKMHWEA